MGLEWEWGDSMSSNPLWYRLRHTEPVQQAQEKTILELNFFYIRLTEWRRSKLYLFLILLGLL